MYVEMRKVFGPFSFAVINIDDLLVIFGDREVISRREFIAK